MTPTTRLRFVERVIAVPATDGVGKTVRVLQQWWACDPDCYEDFLMQVNGAWHDVELGKE